MVMSTRIRILILLWYDKHTKIFTSPIKRRSTTRMRKQARPTYMCIYSYTRDKIKQSRWWLRLLNSDPMSVYDIQPHQYPKFDPEAPCPIAPSKLASKPTTIRIQPAKKQANYSCSTSSMTCWWRKKEVHTINQRRACKPIKYWGIYTHIHTRYKRHASAHACMYHVWIHHYANIWSYGRIILYLNQLRQQASCQVASSQVPSIWPIATTTRKQAESRNKSSKPDSKQAKTDYSAEESEYSETI